MKRETAFRMWACLVLFAGLALRLYAVVRSPAIELDGISYALMAEQFVKGLFGPALRSVFPPVYPLFVGLFHIAVPDTELAGRLVSLFFGMLVIVAAFLFARRVLRYDDNKAAWLAFLLAFQPYLVRYSAAVLSESLAVFLFTLAVFSFYVGLRDERRLLIAACGLCLTLTYLTRPEYIVFFAPFALVLLARRRLPEVLLLLLPFLILGSLYMGYLWSQTGALTISGKATLSPFVPPAAFFGNVPLVAYAFFIALFPPFFVLALFGLKGVDRSYRNLVLLLVAFHVLSLSFVSHATQRYSVEFVPVCAVFVVEGIYRLTSSLKRFLPARPVYAFLVVLVACASVFQSFAPVRHDRTLHKEAGLFLAGRDPGSVVASRLPLAAFYERGPSVDLFSEMPDGRTLAGFTRLVAQRRVKYLVLDEEVEKEMPFLKGYLSGRAPLYSAAAEGCFVRVYRL